MTTTAARRRRSAPGAGTVVTWVLRAGLAAVFAAAGLAKLAGEPAMVELFADVGAGSWLRYLVGVLEVAGAVGLLVPRLAGAAALGLVALMIGATVTNLLVLQTSPVLTVVLGLAAAAVARARTGRRVQGQRVAGTAGVSSRR